MARTLTTRSDPSNEDKAECVVTPLAEELADDVVAEPDCERPGFRGNGAQRAKQTRAEIRDADTGEAVKSIVGDMSITTCGLRPDPPPEKQGMCFTP